MEGEKIIGGNRSDEHQFSFRPIEQSNKQATIRNSYRKQLFSIYAIDPIESSLFEKYPDQTQTFACGQFWQRKPDIRQKKWPYFSEVINKWHPCRSREDPKFKNELVPVIRHIGCHTTGCIEKGFDHTATTLLYKEFKRKR